MDGLEEESSSDSTQLEIMKERSVAPSMWSKPILHPPATNFDSDTWLHVKPCGFCRRGYHFSGIAVALCKDMYHPFCLTKVFERSDNCVFCQEFLHLD